MGPRAAAPAFLLLAAALMAGAAAQGTPDLQVRPTLQRCRRRRSRRCRCRWASAISRLASAQQTAPTHWMPPSTSRTQVLHVNDIHARYDPADTNFGPTCDLEAGSPTCFGGLARLATVLADAKKAAAAAGMDTLVLHAGDQFTGRKSVHIVAVHGLAG